MIGSHLGDANTKPSLKQLEGKKPESALAAAVRRRELMRSSLSCCPKAAGSEFFDNSKAPDVLQVCSMLL